MPSSENTHAFPFCFPVYDPWTQIIDSVQICYKQHSSNKLSSSRLFSRAFQS